MNCTMGLKMFVKVCGITEKIFIDWAIELGFDAVGVVFYPKSKRYIGLDKGLKLAEYAKGLIKTVAVGITFNEVKYAKDHFDYFQMSEYVLDDKLIYSIEDLPNEKANLYILDRSKGSGLFSPLPEWFKAFKDNTIIAGGLTPDNVADVITMYKPFGVDVSSGVEISSGIKSKELMAKFIKNVRKSI